MRHKRLCALFALLWLCTALVAQAGPAYILDWYTVDGGGTCSAGGSYTVCSSIGQADAGTMSGGSYTVYGGFWSADGASGYVIDLPLIMRCEALPPCV